MTWPDDCPNIAILNFNGVACCVPRRGMYLGACLAARNMGCYADFGPWGAWRSCGGALARWWARAICNLAVAPEIATDLMKGEIRHHLGAVGWSI